MQMKKRVFYLEDHRQRSWYEDLYDQNSRLYILVNIPI